MTTRLRREMALIVIGATAVLYFSSSERLWNVKKGEDAPASAKWVAAVVLLAWAGVIVCGQFAGLPLIGGYPVSGAQIFLAVIVVNACVLGIALSVLYQFNKAVRRSGL